jgi:hypothetical protein
MMSPTPHRPNGRKPAALAIASIVLVVALGGCGDKRQPRKNTPRPALPVIVSVFLSSTDASLAPSKVGAGQIELIITNRSDKARRVKLETLDRPGGTSGSIALRTTPISPGEVTTVQALVKTGAYILGAGYSRPTKLAVGKPRPNAQSTLLTP